MPAPRAGTCDHQLPLVMASCAANGQLLAQASIRRPVRVEIFGRADDSTAFAMVNRHWLAGLAQVDGLQIRCVERQEDLSGEADFTIWHSYENDFEAFQAPAGGQFIAVRTWDFGPFPPSWVRKITRECDRLWVHTEWIRQQAIVAGIPGERIAVIPHGVSTEIFCPQGQNYPLPDNRLFYFLIAGAAIRRKGFDLALSAYLSEFSPEDGACLVVKDRPADIFYAGLDHSDAIRRQQAHLGSGSLVYIREHLSPAELASLYRSCDLCVYPYRAEGFGMMILEAMACGTPCIVPRFGACLDYCHDENAILVQPKRIQLPVKKTMPYNTLGFAVEVEQVDFCEIPVTRLAAVMRDAFQAGRDALQALSCAAAASVHENFQWCNASCKIIAELNHLAGKTPIRFLPAA